MAAKPDIIYELIAYASSTTTPAAQTYIFNAERKLYKSYGSWRPLRLPRLPSQSFAFARSISIRLWLFHAEIVYVPDVLVPFINESMYFIWWRRWKRFLEICYLWWNKFVLLVCLCSHSKWWQRIYLAFSVCACVCARVCVCELCYFPCSGCFFTTIHNGIAFLSFALNSCAFDSVFGSQNINKTFSTFCRLNGSAFIFIFVYRFGSLAVQHSFEARSRKSIQIVGKMRLKPKHNENRERKKSENGRHK